VEIESFCISDSPVPDENDENTKIQAIAALNTFMKRLPSK
jgi:hypothetical protein